MRERDETHPLQGVFFAGSSTMAEVTEPKVKFTAVIAVPIAADVLLVIGCDGHGWRFHSWTDHLGEPLSVAPPTDARRQFDSFEAAYARLREQYGKPIRRSERLAQHTRCDRHHRQAV
jgi:hypothetical protein